MLKHISGYRFVSLTDLKNLQIQLLDLGRQLNLLGTILLSQEGININICGSSENIAQFENTLENLEPFQNFIWKKTQTAKPVYKKWSVKIKKEIITTKQTNLTVSQEAASHITPEQLKNWLDQNEDFILLDTRNSYEHEEGSFTKAEKLPIENFTDFFTYIAQHYPAELKNKKTVIFCTGGIRCEKALPFMQQNGFAEIYQLEGGILNYFDQYQSQHYQGGCFVFDERMSVDGSLRQKPLKISC